MRAIIEPPPEPGAPLAPLGRRLAWFVGLALAGAVGTAMVAYGLRALLR
jgi:predicted cobalt transporter CbtA